jgi:hypothetical protein
VFELGGWHPDTDRKNRRTGPIFGAKSRHCFSHGTACPDFLAAIAEALTVDSHFRIISAHSVYLNATP